MDPAMAALFSSRPRVRTKDRSILRVSTAEALERSQRGVPRAEVVDGDLDPDPLEGPENLAARIGVLHGDGLGDLELEGARL